LDLLTINRHGQLVVIEIKASEDITLPLQGLDYWLCVEEARRKREFQRRGLFPGLKIADVAAELWLVSPELRFHKSFEMVAASISSEVSVSKLAVGGDWRRRIIVRRRERMS
jgi:hypothetical protein